MGHKLNPYDRFVFTKDVDRHQHTIGWNADDFIMTQKDPAVNNTLIDRLQKKYGTMTPLTVHRGHVYEYLGMTLDFAQSGRVVFNMVDYLERLLDEALDDFAGDAATPAGKQLFDISKQSPQFEGPLAMAFHHLVSKTPFLAKGARPDLQLAVQFLGTPVRSPT